MLRTIQGKKLFMITQPDHAEVAGYLAAHWGNEEFALPGYFASSRDPERLRAETVFAIATHDNGWWEWEATPEISDIDGLPLNLSDVLKNQAEGMNRWHLAIPRFSKDHPYASLLISFHAYWLYAHSYETDSNPAFIHPLFWKGSQLFHHNYEELKNAQKFVAEIKDIQNDGTAIVLLAALLNAARVLNRELSDMQVRSRAPANALNSLPRPWQLQPV